METGGLKRGWQGQRVACRVRTYGPLRSSVDIWHACNAEAICAAQVQAQEQQMLLVQSFADDLLSQIMQKLAQGKSIRCVQDSPHCVLFFLLGN